MKTLKLASLTKDTPENIDYFEFECEGSIVEKVRCFQEFIDKLVKDGYNGLVLPQTFDTEILFFMSKINFPKNFSFYVYKDNDLKLLDYRTRMTGSIVYSQKNKCLYVIEGSAPTLDIFGRLFYYGCYKETRECSKCLRKNAMFLPSIRPYGRFLPANIQMSDNYDRLLASPDTSFSKNVLFPPEYRLNYVEALYDVDVNEIDFDVYMRKYNTDKVYVFPREIIRKIFTSRALSLNGYYLNYCGFTHTGVKEVSSWTFSKMQREQILRENLEYISRFNPNLKKLLETKNPEEIYRNVKPCPNNEENLMKLREVLIKEEKKKEKETITEEARRLLEEFMREYEGYEA